MAKLVREHRLLPGMALEFLVLAHSLDRRGEQVGVAAQEGDVVLAKIAMRLRIDFQHAERLFLADHDHVDHALHAVAQENFGDLEPGLGIDIV